jgi:phosphoketolase
MDAHDHAVYLKQRLTDLLTVHKGYIREHGEDMLSVQDWRWPLAS